MQYAIIRSLNFWITDLQLLNKGYTRSTSSSALVMHLCISLSYIILFLNDCIITSEESNMMTIIFHNLAATQSSKNPYLVIKKLFLHLFVLFEQVPESNFVSSALTDRKCIRSILCSLWRHYLSAHHFPSQLWNTGTFLPAMTARLVCLSLSFTVMKRGLTFVRAAFLRAASWPKQTLTNNCRCQIG